MTAVIVHFVIGPDRAACGIERRREIIIDDGQNPPVRGAVHGTVVLSHVTCKRCRRAAKDIDFAEAST